MTLWTVVCLAPLSMGFSMQEYWSGLVECHSLLQGYLPKPGIKPASLMSHAVAGGLFTSRATWEDIVDLQCCVNLCCAVKRFSYMYIYTFFFFIFFSMMVYHRILDIVPCATQ